MKKHMFILLLLSIAFISSYGQSNAMTAERRQRWEQRGDSAVASREVGRMKQLFAITAEQEKALFAAGITINRQRHQVYKAYGRTDAFGTQLAKVNGRADSLYQSIIGVDNYELYKGKLHSRLALRPMTAADSLHRKTQQP